MTVDEMARLHHACFQDLRPWPAAEIAEVLRNPHSFCLHRDNGFLLGSAVAGEAEILTLAVDPDARRQGIGRDLVMCFIKTASEKGAFQAYLEVEDGNAAAIALYESCGFAKAGLRRGYYRLKSGAIRDALVFSRTIPIQAAEI